MHTYGPNNGLLLFGLVVEAANVVVTSEWQGLTLGYFEGYAMINGFGVVGQK